MSINSNYSRPVLITDALKEWKASNWSKEFFVKHYGDQQVVMKAVHVCNICWGLYLAYIENIKNTLTFQMNIRSLTCQRPAGKQSCLKQKFLAWNKRQCNAS
jgi:hypothetical protein